MLRLWKRGSAVNAAERSLFHIAVALFAVGLVVRYLPWGIPSIDTFEVGAAPEVAASGSAAATSLFEMPTIASDPYQITDKLTDDSGQDKKSSSTHKKSKKRKSHKKIVRLPIHINQASMDELCALKGVGPKMAEKIIAVREASGPFKNASDLQKVPGIGKKKAETMLQGIIFD